MVGPTPYSKETKTNIMCVYVCVYIYTHLILQKGFHIDHQWQLAYTFGFL